MFCLALPGSCLARHTNLYFPLCTLPKYRWDGMVSDSLPFPPPLPSPLSKKVVGRNERERWREDREERRGAGVYWNNTGMEPKSKGFYRHTEGAATAAIPSVRYKQYWVYKEPYLQWYLRPLWNCNRYDLNLTTHLSSQRKLVSLCRNALDTWL